MRYNIAPLYCRPWTLNGITPHLIESHYENDYGNALNRLNVIAEELASLDPATTPAHVISRLKRDEVGALNSTLLHELYFASLGGDGRNPRLRIGASLAPGVHRARRVTGGWFRLSAAYLRAA
jgi:superoxide dismutase, Fe-Mn family